MGQFTGDTFSSSMAAVNQYEAQFKELVKRRDQRSAVGNSTVNLLPSPGALSTLIVPR